MHLEFTAIAAALALAIFLLPALDTTSVGLLLTVVHDTKNKHENSIQDDLCKPKPTNCLKNIPYPLFKVSYIQTIQPLS